MESCEQERIQPKFFYIFFSIFISTWLVSDIAAIKIVYFFGVSLTGGFLTFPLTTTLNSLITDVYGYKNARLAIWSGIILNLSYLVFINIINVLPSSPEWGLQSSFQSILVPNFRIIMASIISFWIAGFTNSYIMAKLKNRHQSLLKRLIISLSISITLDITVFFILAFLGSLSNSLFLKVYFFAFIKKFICELFLLPIIWSFIDFIKEKEGIDVYDYDTNFTPFSLDNIYNFDEHRVNKKNKNGLYTV